MTVVVIICFDRLLPKKIEPSSMPVHKIAMTIQQGDGCWLEFGNSYLNKALTFNQYNNK
jgi:hypothetical protein